jgi:hypothetical protein
VISGTFLCNMRWKGLCRIALSSGIGMKDTLLACRLMGNGLRTYNMLTVLFKMHVLVRHCGRQLDSYVVARWLF